MKLETSKGKTFEVNSVVPSMRGRGRVIVDLPYTGQEIAELAPDFTGLETMRREDPARGEGVYETYVGYTRLIGAAIDDARGAIRMTLERGGGA